MRALDGYEEVFTKYDAVAFGFSADPPARLKEWREHLKLKSLTFLSDAEPPSRVGRVLGLLDDDGRHRRAVVFIDGEGVLRLRRFGKPGKSPKFQPLIPLLRAAPGPAGPQPQR